MFALLNDLISSPELITSNGRFFSEHLLFVFTEGHVV